MTKQNIPKVRFSGYDDEWERCKLGKLGDFKSGIGFPDNEQGGKSGIPFFKISDMSNIGNEVEMRTANNYVTQSQISRKKWKIIENVPAIIFAKVGAALMLNRKRLVNQPFLIDNNTMSFIFDETWDINFGLAIFQTLYLPQYAQVGALPSYNASDIAAIKVTLPDKVEQSQIDSLFSAVDSLLSSYKDNLENYQSFKKSMLSKMFPKAGQTVPEIRLDGFEGEWEQIKMGKVFTQQVDYIEPNENNELWSLTVEKGLTPKTDRYKRDFLVKKTDKFKRVKPNDFAYNPMNLTLGSLDANQLGKSISVSGYYVVMSIEDYSKYDIDYFKILLKTSFAIFQYKQYATGTLIEKQRVQFPTFSEISFALPSLPEQQALGSFFSNLDDLISSYQAKIEELETLKKKLLQDMFI